jgi:(1->4)-alpha-D-glucan 1-alpha-D-glucosylmutase
VRTAVAELLCGFPVYRSYLPEGRSVLDTAVSVARAHRPDLTDVLTTIRDAMLADPAGELATRVQQTSGMVMAKGVEDTAFYRYNRFVALNEVGGDPDRFGVSPAEFHERCAGRVASWPRTMTTLSTHDTKRSEDVRARLAVLAEIPDEWAPRFRRWAAAHPLPDRSLELLAWQNLVGAWPISAERMAAYLGKASKEAKLVTSHVDANAEVDAAVAAWPEQVLGDAGVVAEIEEFVARIDAPGRSNSLGQKLLQIAGPGCRTSTRAPSSTSTRWSTRTTGGRSTGRCAGSCSSASTAAGCRSSGRRTSTRRGARSCWSRPRRCCCAGSGRSCSPGTGRPGRGAGRAARDRVRPVAAARGGGDPAAGRLAARGGWADTVLPLPDGAATWTDVLTGTPVGSKRPPARTGAGALPGRAAGPSR